MTTANKISIARILMVPFFVVSLMYYTMTGNHWFRLLAVMIFVLAAVSDGVDGYIARRYNQRSELGALLDPLGDKLLLVLGLVFLSQNNEPYFDTIPLWAVATVFSRDLILLIGMLVIYYACGEIKAKPHFTGKISTVLQMVAILWALLLWDKTWLGWWCFGFTFFTAVSGLIYIKGGIQQLGSSPTSFPDPNQKRKKE